MKILFYESSGSGGFATYCKQLMSAISLDSNKKITVYYQTVKNNNDCKSYYHTYANLLSMKKHRILRFKLIWMLQRCFIALANLIKRKQLIRKLKPDIININQLIPIFDQFFLKKIKKYAQLIITVHDVIPPTKSIMWNKHNLRRIFLLADLLIVHSLANKQQLIKEFKVNPGRIRVISHGIELIANEVSYEEANKKINLLDNKKHILFFGSIRESKGLDVLLRAFSKVNNHNYTLMIVGSMPFGENFEKYQTIIDNNKINVYKKIEFIKDEEIEYFFQASDFIVLPYVFFESQSGVFMKAISYKKPVIITDVSGFKEFLDTYSVGILVPPCNEIKLAEAIDECLTDTKKFEVYEHGCSLALSRLSWEKIALLHIQEYKRLLKEVY